MTTLREIRLRCEAAGTPMMRDPEYWTVAGAMIASVALEDTKEALAERTCRDCGAVLPPHNRRGRKPVRCQPACGVDSALADDVP